VSHFLELDIDEEVLRFGRSAGLIEDEVNTLWSQVHMAVDSLASHAPSSVARNPSRAQENSIGDITCNIDRIGPKASRSPMLIEHRPCHLN
jgi:hypothetical protein